MEYNYKCPKCKTNLWLKRKSAAIPLALDGRMNDKKYLTKLERN